MLRKFVWDMRLRSGFTCRLWVSNCSGPTCFWKSHPSSIGHLLVSLLQVSWGYLCGLISEISILFHWPTCLFLLYYCTVLIITSIGKDLKLGRLIPPMLSFFFKIILVILASLPSHKHLRSIFSTKLLRTMMGITLNLCIKVGEYWRLVEPLYTLVKFCHVQLISVQWESGLLVLPTWVWALST